MALRQPCIHATAALGDPALAQTGGGKSARWPVPGPWLPVGAGRSYVFAAPSLSLLSSPLSGFSAAPGAERIRLLAFGWWEGPRASPGGIPNGP